MVGSGIDRLQDPATDLGVFATNGFHLATLSLVQEDGTLGHSIATPRLEQRLRGLVAFVRLSPPPRIPGQPCSISRPRDEVGKGFIHFLVLITFLTRYRISVSGTALAAGEPVDRRSPNTGTPVASAIPLRFHTASDSANPRTSILSVAAAVVASSLAVSSQSCKILAVIILRNQRFLAWPGSPIKAGTRHRDMPIAKTFGKR